ncbi:MAG: hypothetical protein AAF513_03275 [Pseudomonadota bacterium]
MRYLLAVLAVACIALPGHAGVVCVGACTPAPVLNVGSFGGGSGELIIDGGSVVTAPDGAFIGQDTGPGESGTVTVRGGGTRLDTGGGTNSILFVGSSGGSAGNGTLNVTDGAVVTSNAFNPAPGGFGDTRLFLGSGGNGEVNVTNGGRLIVQDPNGYGADDGIQLGRSVGSATGSGVMNVDGAGSSVAVVGNNAFINIGGANHNFAGTAAGRGELNVTNGASISVDGGAGFGLISLARGGGSTGRMLVSGNSTVDITGAQPLLTVADSFSGATGNSGSGSLVITDGGQMRLQATTPGASFAAVGFGLGSGSVAIDNGGLLDIDGRLFISRNTQANDTQTGTVRVNGSGVLAADLTTVGNGTRAGINGILAGTGTVVGNVLVQTGGLLDPGLSPGTLTIDGDLSFDGGNLLIEIAGRNAGQFDFLDISGIADFNTANIEFAFLNGFRPSQNDVFNFVSAQSLLGLDAANVVFSGLGSGFEFLFKGGALVTASVPTPMALPLLVLGLFALIVRCRRRGGLSPHR